MFCFSSEAAGRKSNFEIVLKHLCKNRVLSLYVIASICVSKEHTNHHMTSNVGVDLPCSHCHAHLMK